MKTINPHSSLDLCLRIVVFLLAIALGGLITFVSARDALAAGLKTSGTITGSTLTLGDIFDGIDPEKGAMVLGPAPQPGSDMVLNARTLMQIAAATDLDWRPASSAEQIVIRRAVTIIDESDISKDIETALREKGATGTFDLKFAGVAPKIILPNEQPASFDIENLEFDPQRGTFSATLMAPSKEIATTQIAIAGQIQRMISVPVLKNALRAGDIIGNSDLAWIDMPERSLQTDYILSANDVIGMTPRRMSVAGKPLRGNELEYPQIVSRGDTVTIVFEEGPLVLTAQGRALQGGAKGDVIRVVNNNSSRSLDAQISADRTVTVSP